MARVKVRVRVRFRFRIRVRIWVSNLLQPAFADTTNAGSIPVSYAKLVAIPVRGDCAASTGTMRTTVPLSQSFR